MKVPTDLNQRWELYKDLIRQCTQSQQSRRAFYSLARNYYLFACNQYGDQERGRYNKLGPHLKQLNSFLFAPDTTRFNIDLGPSVPGMYGEWVQPMVELLKQNWHGGVEYGLDSAFAGAVEWGNVYGCMLIKLRPRVRKKLDGNSTFNLEHYLVEPHNFGVLREDRPGLYKQEAFCENYSVTKSQLMADLRDAAHPKATEIEALFQTGAYGSDLSQAGATIDNLIVTSIQGASTSGVASMISVPLSTLYKPQVTDSIVSMTELYVFDDDIGDWRVITIANQDIPIYDMRLSRVFVEKTLPYIAVIPRPAYDYFYGYSAAEPLIPVQDMRNETIDDIRHLLRKQAHAPTSMTGVSGIPDEMKLALDTPKGLLTVSEPSASIKDHPPKVSADMWADVAQIDEMFNEISGIPAIAEGKNPKGVRSEAQAAALAELGAARPKQNALLVEQPLNMLATTLVRVLRKYDKRPLLSDSEKPVQFFAHQFPEDFIALVDGHSSSPLFLNQFETKVFRLLELGVIDKEEALELLDIPRKKQLLSTLRTKIEPAEAEAHKEAVALKVRQIESKRSRGQHPPASPRPQPPQPPPAA